MNRCIRGLALGAALATASGAAADAHAPEAVVEPDPVAAAPDALLPATGEADEARGSTSAAHAEATDEPPRRGGLIGAVLEWLRGGAEEAEAAPAPGSALAAVPVPVPDAHAEPEVMAAPAPPAESALAPGARAVTLAEAHRAAGDLVAEIELLRRAQGLPDAPAQASPGAGREAAVHAWLESIEVVDKAARVQRRFGMIAFEPGAAPALGATLDDIHRNVVRVIAELRRVKRQLVVEARIESAPPEPDPTPEHLHARLAHASALLDALVGRPVSSNDVFIHLRRVRAALAPLAARLGVALAPDPAPGEEGAKEAKAPRDAAQQVLIATYKAVNLQSRLGMAPSDVPDAPSGEVTPGEVYEALNRLMVELARIHAHLGVETSGPGREETRGMRSADVVAQAQRLIADLDRVSRAVAGAG